MGLLSAFISASWGFRYVLLGRKLRKSNPDLRPKPKDAIRAVRIGIIISMVGMLLTIFRWVFGGWLTVAAIAPTALYLQRHRSRQLGFYQRCRYCGCLFGG